MGGICGIVHGSEVGALDPGLLGRMNAAIAHRGADGDQLWLDERGHGQGRGDFEATCHAGSAIGAVSRPASLSLAPADTRTHGSAVVGLGGRGRVPAAADGTRWPLANEDGTCWLVVDGEVANHVELRRELERRGHRFRTRASGEVILHAFEEFGDRCVHRLHGAFAGAVWDARTQTLFLMRDAIGQRPLFFTEAGGRLLFASEIKALLQDHGVRRSLDPEALYHHLTYRFVPPPATLFDGIRQLPPGHTLTWRDGSVELREYWAGPAEWIGTTAQLAPEECSPAKLRDTLCSAVNAQLGGAAPVGLFLSGGLDSTAIASFMTGSLSEPVQTFAVGFRDAGAACELRQARAVAEHLHTEHHELILDAGAVELLPAVLRRMDMPCAAASALPLYLLSQFAGRHVDVILSGVGADELFGGHPRHRAVDPEQGGGLPSSPWLASALHRFLPQRTPALLSNRCSAPRIPRRLWGLRERERHGGHAALDLGITGRLQRDLLATAADDRYPSSLALAEAWFARAGAVGAADQALYADLKCFLPGEPLCVSERMTAAHALEARFPFLDDGLVQYAARIPASLKLSGIRTKQILRQAVDSMVPPFSLDRPTRGLSAPIDRWLRRELRGCVDLALGEAAVRERGLFRPAVVRQLVEEHRAGRPGRGQQVWMLFVLELWQRMYLDSDGSCREDVTFSELGLREMTGSGRRNRSQRVAPALPAEERRAA